MTKKEPIAFPGASKVVTGFWIGAISILICMKPPQDLFKFVKSALTKELLS